MGRNKREKKPRKAEISEKALKCLYIREQSLYIREQSLGNDEGTGATSMGQK